MDGCFFLNATHMQIHAHIHMYRKHVDRTSIHISEVLICIKNEQLHKLKEILRNMKPFTIETRYETSILTQILAYRGSKPNKLLSSDL